MSIILLGMPGAGKSTLGRAFAASMGLPFIDTDTLLEQHLGCSLQQALDARGYLSLREVEGKVIESYSWPTTPVVVATGGSAVYSAAAMQRLRQLGLCVYLEVSLPTVKSRVQNWQNRGFAAPAGQTLQAVFAEREALYLRYCHVRLPCDGLDQAHCLQRLRALYAEHQS